ncbi:MAG: hypothetical protein V1793_11875 [Pseudomonadota bacterium]
MSCILFILVEGADFRARAGEVEFGKIQSCFRNFFTCEMARSDADVYFDKKPFDIVSTHVSDVRTEGGLLVVTGTVTCWVAKKNETLFAALGIRTIMGHELVSYMTVRNQGFSILASELARFPYKPGCLWIQYWVNEN